MSAILGMVLILSFNVLDAEADSGESVKQLKRGQIFTFEGHFSDGKVMKAEVECLGPSDVSKLGLDCGHGKHCTSMTLGEEGQTAHLKFKCGQ